MRDSSRAVSYGRRLVRPRRGRRTPLVIAAGVARVVIGCLDPNPAVNGNGVTMLRAAGIEVTTGVCEGEAKQLIEPFLRSVDHNSYLTLKWAQSADGKVAGPGGKRTRISGPESSRLVHQLRARAEAIVIGIGTAMIDDPMLTPRDVPLRRKLLRIVLDPRLRLPLTSKLVTTAGEWPTAVIYDERHPNRRRVEELRAKGVAVHGYEGFGDRNPSDAADTLQLIREELHVHDLFMEPGPTLAGSYLSFTDRLWVFRSPMRIDDPTAPTATGIPLHLLPTRTIRVGDDELTEYRRLMIDEQTDQPYAVTPSADLVLASAARDRR